MDSIDLMVVVALLVVVFCLLASMWVIAIRLGGLKKKVNQIYRLLGNREG